MSPGHIASMVAVFLISFLAGWKIRTLERDLLEQHRLAYEAFECLRQNLTVVEDNLKGSLVEQNDTNKILHLRLKALEDRVGVEIN